MLHVANLSRWTQLLFAESDAQCATASSAFVENLTYLTSGPYIWYLCMTPPSPTQQFHSGCLSDFATWQMHRFGGAPQEINLDTIEDLEAFTAGGWGKVAKENVPKDEFSLHIPKSTVAVIHLPYLLPHHPLNLRLPRPWNSLVLSKLRHQSFERTGLSRYVYGACWALSFSSNVSPLR